MNPIQINETRYQYIYRKHKGKLPPTHKEYQNPIQKHHR